jgi:hypothetical protein
MYLYGQKQEMKKLLFFAAILLSACGGKYHDYQKAENALDAGREFINACLQGDFGKASFYMVQTEKNKQKLKEAEKIYREKDRDGRQQSRTASLIINEIKDINDSTTFIYFSYSFNKQPQTLQVVRQNGTWLVNFDFTDTNSTATYIIKEYYYNFKV